MFGVEGTCHREKDQGQPDRGKRRTVRRRRVHLDRPRNGECTERRRHPGEPDDREGQVRVDDQERHAAQPCDSHKHERTCERDRKPAGKGRFHARLAILRLR